MLKLPIIGILRRQSAAEVDLHWQGTKRSVTFIDMLKITSCSKTATADEWDLRVRRDERIPADYNSQYSRSRL